MKEYQQRIVKDNSLKNAPKELVEIIGKENLYSITEYLKNWGKSELAIAYKKQESDPIFSMLYANMAAHLDAQYRIIVGENLFSEPKDREFLSEIKKESFFASARRWRDGVNRYDAIDYLIISGEKLGTAKQRTWITKSIKRDFNSIGSKKLSNHLNHGKTSLGELAANYRIFTEKPLDKLIESLNENQNLQNKITQESILNNLEDRIKEGLNKKEYYPIILEDIAAYRILTAKEIKIIPGKGIVFPK